MQSRSLLLLVVLVSLAKLSYAQAGASSKAKLSPFTQFYLKDIQQNESGEPLKEYVYRKDATGRLYLGAIVKVNKTVRDRDFEQLGVRVGTRAGNIWTVSIPTEQLQAFTQVEGVDYIAVDMPIAPDMKNARVASRVDSVHGGYAPLQMAYSGKGVVVGIIDAGFDYAHPSLRDTAGGQWRIKRIWEQKGQGTPPNGQTYGDELTDSTKMKQKGTDLTQFSHGAHVAGIAAGSGVGSNNKEHRGVAYSSDLVLVGITPDSTQWMNTGMADILDGISYIYSYASSVSKPAVVNLSWGCSVGPHDGTSLFSQACDNMTNQGKIFVCSAGNNGDNYLHVDKSFSATDTIVNTELELNSALNKTWVDVWGEKTKNFCMQVTLYNGSTAGATTGFICLDNKLHQDVLVGTDGDTCWVEMVTESASFNGKPRVFLRFHQKSKNTIVVSAKGNDGDIHMWTGYVDKTRGIYGRFWSSGTIPNTTAGKVTMTVGDMATTKSAIAVASYASTVNYKNVDGGVVDYSSWVQNGKRAPYSSIGPSLDNRVKPDISAPGLFIGSAVSIFDDAYKPSTSSRSSVVAEYKNPIDNLEYRYAMLTGTSMSSPVVAGIVAQMLEANPKLGPEDVRNILQTTAIQDAHTGSISIMKKEWWGYGKVNAFGAVQQAITYLTINNTTGAGTIDAQLYPNPTTGRFHIDFNSAKAEDAYVTLYDMMGKKLTTSDLHLNIGANHIALDVSDQPKGLYFVKLVAPQQGNASFKLMLK
ncbi:MAG: S8/S53 family peptidase [Flavipsychrobacter sp.]